MLDDFLPDVQSAPSPDEMLLTEYNARRIRAIDSSTAQRIEQDFARKEIREVYPSQDAFEFARDTYLVTQYAAINAIRDTAL